MPTNALGIRHYRTDDADSTLALLQCSVTWPHGITPRAQIEAWAGNMDQSVRANSLERQCTWMVTPGGTPTKSQEPRNRPAADVSFETSAVKIGYHSSLMGSAMIATGWHSNINQPQLPKI